MPNIITDDIGRTIDLVNQAIVDYECAGSQKERETSLRRAFVATCQFLKRLLASNFFEEYAKLIEGLAPGYSSSLADLVVGHPALAILHDKDQFHKFLEFERDLLHKAKFDPDFVGHIIQSVKQSFEELFKVDFTPATFRECVMAYKEVICKEGDKTPNDANNAVSFLSGLALISVDTAAGALLAPAPPVAVTVSVALSGAIGSSFASRAIGAVFA
jgi:hypothetical protein